jgi:DNA-binding SARP family transcriptional activator/tetratricopeptide (TPR) repeat protein
VPTEDFIILFGPPSLKLANSSTAVQLEWQRPAALLAYLACRPGWHSRERLCEIVRPDATAKAGRAYLRKLLHRTREVYPEIGSLETSEQGVRWAGGSDVRDFQAAIAEARWADALALQVQPFLSNVGTLSEPILDDWFHEEGLRLREQLRGALIASIVSAREDSVSDSSELMQRLAELDPLDENAVQFLLVHAKTPLEKHTATAAFQTLQRRYATELGQRPLPKTVDLFRSFQGGEMDESLATASRFPIKEFVGRDQSQNDSTILGRERELASLQDLLKNDAVRLVTVFGLGGAGKTSLARALFEKSVQAGARHCVWVDLFGTDTAHAMLDAIALQVGLSAREGSLEDQLAHWLATRKILLFLDNFEQLVAHSPIIENLLRTARDVKFVVTSREALRVPQEHLFWVSGLGCTDQSSPAVKLFHLHSQRLGHVVNVREAENVLALVSYLEGLPLAIELAASWVTLLPVGAILKELRADPMFLDGGSEVESRASRTIRAVFNTTWKRLDAAEQDAMVSLSTVVGSMDLDTARKVADADAGVFLRLVSKSLLQRSQDGHFRIHPLVREFARRQATSDALSRAQQRHSEHFLARVSQPPPLRLGRYMPQRVTELAAQAEDIAHAWRGAVDLSRFDLLDAALPNLPIFLFSSGRYEEAKKLAEYASAAVKENPRLLGNLAVMTALSSLRLGTYSEAESCARRALLGNTLDLAQRSLLNLVLARIHRIRGQYEEGLSCALQALDDVAEGEGDFLSVRMSVLEEVGFAWFNLGQPERAEPFVLSTLALARKHDAKIIEGKSLCTLGMIKEAMGFPKAALPLLEASVGIFREIGDPYQLAICLNGLSYIHLNLGNPKEAISQARLALQTFVAEGYEQDVADTLVLVMLAQDAAGEHEQSMQTCREAMQKALRDNNVPVALRCIGLTALFRLRLSRDASIALLCFTIDHPQFRKRDLDFVRKYLAPYQVSDEELSRGRERSAGWTFDFVAGMLLEEQIPQDN